MDVYFGVLRSAGSFFAKSNSVTRTEWNVYVNFLNPKENYPGIEGMGVIRYIPDGQKGAFENTAKRKNKQSPASNPDELIRPSNVAYAIRPPGVRASYYPVTYFWPPSEHIDPLGLDHGAYPAGLQALEKARDSGTVTLSDPLPYAQGGDRNPPVLLLFPVYRSGLPITTTKERQKALRGFVYERINMEALFRNAISSSVSEEIYLEVFEGHDSDQETPSLDKARLIYDADTSDIPHALNTSYKPRHHTIEKVGVDSAHLFLYVSGRPDGTAEQRDNLPLFILFAGSFLSIGASIIAFLRNRQTQLIHQHAYHDHLTGLPNRKLLQDRFQQALANAQRHGAEMALLFLDLDNFKPINDSLGHDTGDKVLKAVATRLASCLRQGDSLSRLGGDEFVILLSNIAGEEDASSVAQKIIDTALEPIPMNGQYLQVGCSIGISIFPKDGAGYDALLKNADAAMYRAKEAGRNNFQFYT